MKNANGINVIDIQMKKIYKIVFSQYIEAHKTDIFLFIFEIVKRKTLEFNYTFNIAVILYNKFI